jgi:predicted transposase YdaD
MNIGGREACTKMAKRQRQRTQPTPEQQQPYDNLLKSLLEGQEEKMLPYFLHDVVYLETLDIEVVRPLLRIDRVYKILYKGEAHILHLEFETGSNNRMAARLLDYHAYLYRKYDLPVISIIVYPFRTAVATSPLEEISHGKTVLVFHFQVFPLWLLSAEQYVQEHAVAMYALLPAMEGANAQLLSRAIDEMVQYYQNDERTLARELRWLGIVLRRAEIVPLEEKRVIEERLNMYDDLMEKDPKMIWIRAESEARGEAKGEAKGEVKGARAMIIAFVQARFPALLDLARKKVKQVTTTDDLQHLFQQLMSAADEDAARALLT